MIYYNYYEDNCLVPQIERGFELGNEKMYSKTRARRNNFKVINRGSVASKRYST